MLTFTIGITSTVLRPICAQSGGSLTRRDAKLAKAALLISSGRSNVLAVALVVERSSSYGRQCLKGKVVVDTKP